MTTPQRILTVLRIALARLRFVAVFVVAALLVGYWDHIKARVDKWTRPDHAYGQTAPGEDYYCPMHPQVVRTQPGLCPICSMDLKKRTPGERAAAVRDRVQLSPHRVAMAGVATTPVAFKPLVRHVRALGLLDYDETRLANISARVAGRADELFVTYTGQSVKAGEPVYSLYSPEVFTAQREYLQARKRVNDLPADAAPEARADASAVYNASMQKLVLWGIAREQLDKLDKEFDASGKVPTHFPVASPLAGIVVRKDVTPGQYLQVGQSAYTIADLSSLWLRAKVYEADIPLVHIGQKVSVTVDALPNEPLTGTVTFVAFALDPETRTLDARIEVPNKDLRLRPGMFATARISVPAMPAAGASSRPATSPSTPLQSATGNRQSAILQQALQPYLRASDLLANDKLDGVPALLAQSVTTLEPLAADPALKDALARLTAAVNETPGEDIKALRTTFKKVSNALIDVAKITGQPVDAPPVQIFRCPMQDKPYWLQPASATAVNPYMGQRMLDCGGPVENLPRAAPPAPAGTDIASHAAHALAIPRSAVIDTGTRKIVYVQTAPGVFDLRAVTLGPLSSDDLYPVLSGLKENDHVVTAGAFLVDSENRLNPAPLEEADSPQRRGERGGGAVKAGSEKSAPGHVH